MRVLGIETSCDDTGVAIYDDEKGLLVHKLASQIELHQPYGGVVPELAARDHIRTLTPLVDAVINDVANQGQKPDAVAYTAGPGLAGALLVGASVGRSLAFGWGVPAVGVHHMEGHLLAPMLETTPPQAPFVALLVSGGHTLLVDVKAIGDYAILGQSLDDAAGEAFDKTAKLLGLSYPGGPSIAKVAQLGSTDRFDFPRPMVNRPGLDFSFSGLKTFALTTAQQCKAADDLNQQTVADIAYAFQDAVTDTLMIKCRRALQQTGYQTLVIAGGVGANQQLRQRVREMAEAEGAEVYYPRFEFCTDNGAMIAYAGAVRLRSQVSQSLAFNIQPRWDLDSLSPI